MAAPLQRYRPIGLRLLIYQGDGYSVPGTGQTRDSACICASIKLPLAGDEARHRHGLDSMGCRAVGGHGRVGHAGSFCGLSIIKLRRHEGSPLLVRRSCCGLIMSLALLLARCRRSSEYCMSEVMAVKMADPGGRARGAVMTRPKVIARCGSLSCRC
jgi:hypothetical protein